MERSVTIALGGREWKITRARLGGFLRLQRQRELVYKAIESQDNRQIVDGLYAFLTVAIPDLDWETYLHAPWYENFAAYVTVESINRIPNAEQFSILRFSQPGGKRVPWDHDLRSITLWIHIIASAYSWTRTEIENLWPEEAVAFVQEILVDQQEEREFIHAHSRLAYEYNKATKKSHFRPLDRPVWMMVKKKRDVMTKLRKDMLPVGKIEYPPGTDEDLMH